jgi:hypothetical protein
VALIGGDSALVRINEHERERERERERGNDFLSFWSGKSINC